MNSEHQFEFRKSIDGGFSKKSSPGKKGIGQTNTMWERDIALDVMEMQRQHFDMAFCFLSDVEYTSQGLAGELERLCGQYSIQLRREPLVKGAALNMEDVDRVAREIETAYKKKHRIALFSTNGWGRAALIAACVLARLKPSWGATKIAQHIRQVRSPWCLANPEYVKFLETYVQRVQAEEVKAGAAAAATGGSAASAVAAGGGGGGGGPAGAPASAAAAAAAAAAAPITLPEPPRPAATPASAASMEPVSPRTPLKGGKPSAKRCSLFCCSC